MSGVAQRKMLCAKQSKQAFRPTSSCPFCGSGGRLARSTQARRYEGAGYRLMVHRLASQFFQRYPARATGGRR
eukprot:8576990-Alexandrium_andersonii.AAC.1